MSDEQGESLQERLDRIGAEAEAGEPELNQPSGEPTMTAADGRGILGKDFLGGADPAEVIREMRDAEFPADGGYVLASSEEEALEVVRQVTEAGGNAAPVKFEADDNDMATLTFGPMPMDDLLEMLEYIGTAEGSASFLGSLVGALKEQNAAQAQEG